jgi:hypothetical protein
MAAKLKGHYVMLRAGKLRLLLPQADVSAAEYRDCNPVPTPRAGVFAADFAGATHDVMAPSEHLVPLDDFPASRFVLTRLEDGAGGAIWLAWDEVRVFINPAFSARPLPVVMRAPGMPATTYVEIGDDIALCADAPALVACLRAQEESPP